MAQAEFKIVARETWGAAAPHGNFVPIPTEQDRLWQHHSATFKYTGFDAPRQMQQIAFSRGFTDISYTHVVDTLGGVYEGRGIGRLGAHTLGDNEDSWAIVAVGNFDVDSPPPAMLNSIARLTRAYFNRDWDARLGLDGGHRDAHTRGYCPTATACPGRLLWDKIDEINKMAKDRPWKDGTSLPDPVSLPILRLNDEGKRVEFLQRKLTKVGFNTNGTDGFFGPNTKKAVQSFKDSQGLNANGIVGVRTWRRLFQELEN